MKRAILILALVLSGMIVYGAQARTYDASADKIAIAQDPGRAYAHRMLKLHCVPGQGGWVCPMAYPGKSGKSFQGNIGDGTAGRPACTGYTVWLYWSNGYRTWQCRWASAPGYYWAAL